MGNRNETTNKNTFDKLHQIKVGAKINDKWTSYLRQIKLLGQGAFARVYLAESIHDKKLYVVKETLT